MKHTVFKTFFGLVLLGLPVAAPAQAYIFVWEAQPRFMAPADRETVLKALDQEMKLSGYRAASDGSVLEPVYVKSLPFLQGKLVLHSAAEQRVTCLIGGAPNRVHVRAVVEIVSDEGRLDITETREADSVRQIFDRVRRALEVKKPEKPSQPAPARRSSTTNFNPKNTR